MAKVLNQNQTLNYLADLPLLLGQARTFLDLKNRQGKETPFKEIDQLLRVYALNLTLVNLEEFEDLPFEKVFERLEWLFEQEKLIGSGSVPVNLAELEAQLQEKEEKAAKETARREKLAQEGEKLAADLKKRAELLAALKKAQIETKIEAAPDWQAVVENLPENEELANFIQKTITNPELHRFEKEKLLQESWERLLSQQPLPVATLKEIKEQPLSLESFELMAGQIKRPPEERKDLIGHLERISHSPTQEQAASLKESLVVNMVAFSPLARDLDWEGTAKSVALQIKDEFKEIPLEQINLLALQLAKEAERVVPAKSLPTDTSIFSPPVIMVGEKMVPFVAAQEIPDNPKGNPWQVKAADNQPLPYYWTIKGNSPEELERLGRIQQMVTGDPHSPTKQFLSDWSIKLKGFQTQYFSQEAVAWQVNRVKVIFSTSQIVTPLAKISQQAKDWFFKTSIGQTAKLWIAKTSQKSLEALWATARTGVKTAVTKGVTALLTKIGLQAVATVANTVAPVIGGLIVLFGEKLIKRGFSLIRGAGRSITSGLGLTNAVLEGITGQREVKEESEIGRLAAIGVFGTFILVATLILFIKNQVKNGALLGLGRGGPSGPGTPLIGEPPQCHATRHFAEEVICSLTTGNFPCDQKKVNRSTWSAVNQCFDIVDFSNGREEAIRAIFYNSVSKYISLQCVGFAYAVQYALGREVIKHLPHNSACDYAHGAPPPHYRFVEWNERIEKGDLAIWEGAECGVNNGLTNGHIAVVVDVYEVQVVVADAIGDSKGVRGDLLIHSVANDGRLKSPRRFLRYSP